MVSPSDMIKQAGRGRIWVSSRDLQSRSSPTVGCWALCDRHSDEQWVLQLKGPGGALNSAQSQSCSRPSLYCRSVGSACTDLGLCLPGAPGERGLYNLRADCSVWEPGALYFPISPYFPSPERRGGKFQNAGLAQVALLAACPSRGSA